MEMFEKCDIEFISIHSLRMEGDFVVFKTFY